MGIQPNQSSLLVPGLKGRLIRDSYIQAKQAIRRPKIVKLLDQAETLIPNSFAVVDESVSSAYLRLMHRDPDENFIFLISTVSLSIIFSCIQALLKSIFVLFDIGMQKQSTSTDGESFTLSISERVFGGFRFLADRLRTVVQILVDGVQELHDLIDQDGDGHIGAADLLRFSFNTLCYLARFAKILTSVAFHYFLIGVHKLIDIVVPAPPGPIKPPTLFHQNSPSKIAEKKIERFQQPEQQQSITIWDILQLLYDRISIRTGPWFLVIASWTAAISQLLWISVRWVRDLFQSSFCCSRAADTSSDTSNTL